MGWSLGYDTNWGRDIGYGVPALCDHPKCQEKIDRGLAHVCGGQPYGGDDGCGLYFCGAHGGGDRCPRCSAHKPPYKRIKPELPKWILWKATDESWAEWRKENLEQVPYVIYVTQGMGGGPEELFWTLEGALQFVEEHNDEASFAIRYPTGEWHDWSNHAEVEG